MNDWEVTVITDSNYIKTIRVNDCYTRQDAEAAALGITGAKRVVVSNLKTYYEDDYSLDSSSIDGTSNNIINIINDGAGILVLGVLLLIYFFWKIFILVGVIYFITWLIVKYSMRNT